jgi:hypothetical protein
VLARAEAWAKLLERVLAGPPDDEDDDGTAPPRIVSERDARAAAAEARSEDAGSWAGLD